MVKITLINNVTRKQVIVDEAAKIVDVLRENGIEIAGKQFSFNGSALSATELNGSLAALGMADGQTAYISTVVKADNAAGVTLRGDALVVTSTVPYAQIEFLEKYNPKALVLMGGEENKEEIFAISTGSNSLCSFGASFGAATRDEAGLAVITLVGTWPENGDEAKGAIADKYGKALGYLEQLEATVQQAYADAKAARDTVMAGITLA